MMQSVLAVTSCYPSRIVLYSAAFHGGWKVEFVKSLAAVVEAIATERPRAVFYDYSTGDLEWERYCSIVTGMGIPFVLITQKAIDATFVRALAAGAFYAAGEPLSSVEILKALDLAEEVSRCDVRYIR